MKSYDMKLKSCSKLSETESMRFLVRGSVICRLRTFYLGYDMKTITFCGHSNLSKSESDIIKEKLYTQIKELICQGAEEFLLGGYGDFDVLCARVVCELKGNYPQIKSTLVIPYINRDYDKTLYDSSEYPPIETVPKRFAISKRNEYMIQRADVVIAYITHNWGGASTTFKYAKRKKKKIIEISIP